MVIRLRTNAEIPRFDRTYEELKPHRPSKPSYWDSSGFDRTYEELKHGTNPPIKEQPRSFDRTYEELKPPTWKPSSFCVIGFDRTYEELKLANKQPLRSSISTF